MKNCCCIIIIITIFLASCNKEDESPDNSSSSNASELVSGRKVDIALHQTRDTLYYDINLTAPGVVVLSQQNENDVALNYRLYRANPTSSTQYNIAITNLPSKAGFQNYHYNVIPANDTIAIGPLAIGMYQLMVLKDPYANESPVKYTLSYTFDGSDQYEMNNEPNNSLELIQADKTYEAYLRGYDDKDYFILQLNEDALVSLNLTNPASLRSINVGLYNSSLQRIDNNTNQANPKTESKYVFGLLNAGLYYIGFSSSPSSSNNRDSYSFSVTTEKVEGVGNTSFDKAVNIAEGDSGLVNLLRGYEDVRYFKVQPSQCVAATFMADVPNSISNLKMQIYDASYNQVATNNPYSNTQKSVTAYLSGGKTYYLSVYNDSYSSNQLSDAFYVNYTVDASDSLECNDTVGGSIPVEPDKDYQSYILLSGDIDYFSFKMDKPGVAKVTATAPSNLDNMEVYIYDGNSSNEKSNNMAVYAGETRTLFFGPLEAGTHYFKISSYNSSPDPYTFKVSTDYRDTYEINNTYLDASEITDHIDTKNITAYLLDYNDVDFYKYTVSTAGTYHFELTAPSVYTNFELYDKPNSLSTSLIKSMSVSPGQQHSTEAALAPGTYYIKISNSSWQEIKDDDAYTLSVTTVTTGP